MLLSTRKLSEFGTKKKANLEPTWTNVGNFWTSFNPIWANLEPTWVLLKPTWGPFGTIQASDMAGVSHTSAWRGLWSGPGGTPGRFQSFRLLPDLSDILPKLTPWPKLPGPTYQCVCYVASTACGHTTHIAACHSRVCLLRCPGWLAQPQHRCVADQEHCSEACHSRWQSRSHRHPQAKWKHYVPWKYKARGQGCLIQYMIV